MIDLLQLIEQFLDLQTPLVATLIATTDFRPLAPGTRWAPEVARWPRRGVVELDGDRWRFHRHGLGYAFERERDGALVDCLDRLEDPAVLEPGRLEQYAESVGITACAVDGEPLATTGYQDLERGLWRLVERGVMRWRGTNHFALARAGDADAGVTPPADPRNLGIVDTSHRELAEPLEVAARPEDVGSEAASAVWWKVDGAEVTVGHVPLHALEDAVMTVLAAYQAAFARKPTAAEWEALLTSVLGGAGAPDATLDDGVIDRVRVEYLGRPRSPT